MAPDPNFRDIDWLFPRRREVREMGHAVVREKKDEFLATLSTAGAGVQCTRVWMGCR